MLDLNKLKYVPVFVVSFVLLACSSVNNLADGDKINYKHGLSATSPLELPPNVNKQNIMPSYVAPDTKTFSQFIEQKMAEQSGQPIKSGIDARIERDGQRRWLVISRPVSDVWPKIEKFWTDLGFTLETNSQATGIMETNWLQNKANVPNDAFRRMLTSVIDYVFSAEKKDKFKTRVENNNGLTEIYITHQGVEEQFEDKSKDTTKYYKRKAEPELEAEVIYKMMLALGLNEQQAAYLKQNYHADMQDGKKAEIKKDKKKSKDAEQAVAAEPKIDFLPLNSNKNNAWRSVGIALDRAGFTLENKDLAQNMYQIRYLDPEQFNQQPGFFKRLVKGQKIDELRKAKIYTIKIQQETANSSKIVVLGDDTNNPEKAATIQKIFKVIQENL
jgi:outer membrane protein assembly factor BamC